MCCLTHDILGNARARAELGPNRILRHELPSL